MSGFSPGIGEQYYPEVTLKQGVERDAIMRQISDTLFS